MPLEMCYKDEHFPWLLNHLLLTITWSFILFCGNWEVILTLTDRYTLNLCKVSISIFELGCVIGYNYNNHKGEDFFASILISIVINVNICQNWKITYRYTLNLYMNDKFLCDKCNYIMKLKKNYRNALIFYIKRLIVLWYVI